MSDLQVMHVIRTELKLLGNGTEENPYRRAIQYWSMDGKLIDEIDPLKHKDGQP